jgi:ubiquinone/menaquinone biosynthesis C-methylase UbiE
LSRQVGEFKDHFSGHAADYSSYRPTYPPELFSCLAEQAPARELAWDCATGNGQAALLLARFFKRIFATDASNQQIRHAQRSSNIEYGVESAEHSSLDDNCVDLVVAAQAYHWFDRPAFLAEVRRVLKPGGLLAILSYQLASVDEGEAGKRIDDVVRVLWGDILDGWWPEERALVDDGLQGLEFPFDDVAAPPFEMKMHWRMDELLKYLGTWSSVKKYQAATGTDPLELITPDLEAVWGEPGRALKIVWPVDLRVLRN